MKILKTTFGITEPQDKSWTPKDLDVQDKSWTPDILDAQDKSWTPDLDAGRLEPRTLDLIVEEIRNAIESGKTQIIATTHSPYFLDLLRNVHEITSTTFSQDSDNKGIANS
jgi:hypothetical protein